MQYKYNPVSGVIQHPLGRDLGWSNQIERDLYEAKQTKVGSITRRKVALSFMKSALLSCGRMERSSFEPGSKDGVGSIGMNTWVVPYLANAIALLTGEDDQIDW